MNGVSLEEQLLIAGYVLGDLSSAEGRLVEQLLANNPALWHDVAQLQRSLELTYSAEATPPSHLKSAVLSASEPAQPSVSPAATRRFDRLTQWTLGSLGAAAALLIAALSVQNYSLRQTLQALQSAPPAQSNAKALRFSLEATESSQPGKIELSVNPAQSTAALKAEGLPPLATDQVYALWTVVAVDAPVTKDSKNAILTAVFTVDEAGDHSQQIFVPSVFRADASANQAIATGNERSLVRAIAVTVEQAAAPQAHQSKPILIQRL